MIYCAFSTTISAQWSSTSPVIDKMTGEVSAYAFSDRVQSDPRMGFPYGNVKAWLGYGCKKNDDWVYIGFTLSPNFTKGDTQDGYDILELRVKWDNKIEIHRFHHTWGSKSIQFMHLESTLKGILESNKVLIEFNWYGEGNVYFEFSLKNSTKAIRSAKRICMKQQ